MAVEALYPHSPLKSDIENKEEVWNTLFDRNSSYEEFYKFGGRLGFPYLDVYSSNQNDNKLEYRCKLDIDNPIGYYPNRWSYVRVNTQPNAELIIDPYDYTKPTSFAQQLRTKHYKVVGRGHVEDQPYRRGYDYEIYEKTFMFIKLINSVNDKNYAYLLPAVLTQKCTAIVEQTRAYYPKTASGTINMALDEFIRRKHNPTQKEVIDFLINLIGNREIYLSEEPSFLAKIYTTRIGERIGERYTLVPHSYERETTFVNAKFIANTDVKSILSNIGYIKY